MADTSATSPASNVFGLAGGRTLPGVQNQSTNEPTSPTTTSGASRATRAASNSGLRGPCGVDLSQGAVAGAIVGAYAAGYTLTCPGSSNGSAAAAAATPIQAAYQAWYHEIILPDPVLATNPTRAITGLDTFLIIRGPQTTSWSGTALGMEVRISITSTYDIDWGDPRPDASVANGRARITGTTSQGGPYPNGNLRHQYIERGNATIQVTQRWTANWSAGGESGTLADRLQTTSSLTLPIDELQAVLTTGP